MEHLAMDVLDRAKVTLSFLVAFGVTSACWASDGKDSDTKRMKREVASTIDFRKTFGLPFEGLTTLGGRIEQARTSSDPVCLAMLATELGVAEKVSGEKASLTSDELMKEATELAKVRASSKELKALCLIVDDQECRRDLTLVAEKAESFEKEQASKAKGGERSRGISGSVQVINSTDDTVQITTNGNVRGYLGPNKAMWLYVGDSPFSRTQLKAIGSDGGLYIKQVENPPPGGNYVWRVDED